MFQFVKMCVALVFVSALGACGASNTASRAAMPDGVVFYGGPNVHVTGFTVHVPTSLTVNEKNTYYPRGDIVWRGELPGDRYAQVKAIFEQALRNAAPQTTGTRPVRVDVQVLRFHALSEKARYSVGGVHNIAFRLRMVDTSTGAPIGPSKVVYADLDALAGDSAIAADGRGETQKVRIIAHLTNVFLSELTTPQGHMNANLGLLQQINQL